MTRISNAANRLLAINFRHLFIVLIATLAVAFIAIFFGLLAVTANPLLIGLGAGLIGGAFLLTVPRLSIWLILVLGLATGAFVSLLSVNAPIVSKLPWIVSLLSFLLLIPAIFKLFLTRNVPAFIWLTFAFVLVTFLSTVLQWYSTAEVIAGTKRYFQAQGLLFALAVMAFQPEDYRRWMKLLLAIALLQLPFSLYELLVLVPERGGLQAGGAATDVVAGTFGANLVGGSANAEMATFVLIALAFLVARWNEKLLSTPAFALLGAICFAPLFLGETKIVVIMLPVIGIILMRNQLVKSPGSAAFGLIIFFLLTMAVGYAYLVFVKAIDLDQAINEIVKYNLRSQGYGNYILNRTTVLTYWWDQQGVYDPVGFFFGHGLGSSFSAGGATLVVGHVALPLLGYGIDLTTASTLLWDTGVIGLILFISIFISAWFAANRLYRESPSAMVRADALAIQAAIALFLIHVLYRNSLVTVLPFQIVVSVILGYLALLVRENRILSPPQTGNGALK